MTKDREHLQLLLDARPIAQHALTVLEQFPDGTLTNQETKQLANTCLALAQKLKEGT